MKKPAYGGPRAIRGLESDSYVWYGQYKPLVDYGDELLMSMQEQKQKSAALEQEIASAAGGGGFFDEDEDGEGNAEPAPAAGEGNAGANGLPDGLGVVEEVKAREKFAQGTMLTHSVDLLATCGLLAVSKCTLMTRAANSVLFGAKTAAAAHFSWASARRAVFVEKLRQHRYEAPEDHGDFCEAESGLKVLTLPTVEKIRALEFQLVASAVYSFLWQQISATKYLRADHAFRGTKVIFSLMSGTGAVLPFLVPSKSPAVVASVLKSLVDRGMYVPKLEKVWVDCDCCGSGTRSVVKNGARVTEKITDSERVAGKKFTTTRRAFEQLLPQTLLSSRGEVEVCLDEWHLLDRLQRLLTKAHPDAEKLMGDAARALVEYDEQDMTDLRDYYRLAKGASELELPDRITTADIMLHVGKRLRGSELRHRLFMEAIHWATNRAHETAGPYFQQKSSGFLECFHSVVLTGDLQFGKLSAQTTHAALGRGAYDFSRNRLERMGLPTPPPIGSLRELVEDGDPLPSPELSADQLSCLGGFALGKLVGARAPSSNKQVDGDPKRDEDGDAAGLASADGGDEQRGAAVEEGTIAAAERQEERYAAVALSDAATSLRAGAAAVFAAMKQDAPKYTHPVIPNFELTWRKWVPEQRSWFENKFAEKQMEDKVKESRPKLEQSRRARWYTATAEQALTTWTAELAAENPFDDAKERSARDDLACTRSREEPFAWVLPVIGEAYFLVKLEKKAASKKAAAGGENAAAGGEKAAASAKPKNKKRKLDVSAGVSEFLGLDADADGLDAAEGEAAGQGGEEKQEGAPLGHDENGSGGVLG
eukprot:g19634.t1